MFKRVLIANRGEIALRTIRACHELGIETVCVFSEDDRDAHYLNLADRAICIGPGAPKDSYLKSDRIIAAAEIANADAVHPGYGFLAENAAFADKCRESNIEFIGPSSESMRLLGDKAAARQLAKKIKVPIVPGSDGNVDGIGDAATLAKKLRYPVMIKATAGGGGRGIRIASNNTELAEFVQQARQEAEAGFGDGRVYLEKYLQRPRHVEVQILADHHGHVVHLFERDCSLQRRYQKLIEEAPSPGIEQRTREELYKAAVKLCKAARYTNAATFEFLVEGKRRFYFIEANTRIQVEHPVTEMITGIDLIKAQIRIAAGEPLEFTQKNIRRNGVAIECRINAEDPDSGFRPSAGVIEKFRPPGGFGVRVDTHVHDGYRISPRYDSLIGKLIVHQPSRETAIECMRRCLDEFVISPTKTTIPLHRKIFRSDAFCKGEVDTEFIERVFNSNARPAPGDGS
ncbi:MAG: acetyl-CoA carboxylase biotin carboxylase subunit [Planctomycetes bacterium]|nr:acetyl-CoA carboxylase biotin carboxylase subunit [Planctomycetota bacterium]